MSLRSRLGMFVLTRQEQRTIAFIVLAVILGLLTQHYRHQHAEKPQLPNDAILQSPTPAAEMAQKADAAARPESTPR